MCGKVNGEETKDVTERREIERHYRLLNIAPMYKIALIPTIFLITEGQSPGQEFWRPTDLEYDTHAFHTGTTTFRPVIGSTCRRLVVSRVVAVLKHETVPARRDWLFIPA